MATIGSPPPASSSTAFLAVDMQVDETKSPITISTLEELDKNRNNSEFKSCIID